MNLVFLHGLLGSPAAWASVERELALPAHALLLPGHGLTPWFSGARFLDAVDAIAARMPEGPSVVVGYSLGARLALGLAAQHPHRVCRAVLIGANPGLRSDEDRHARAAEDEALARTLDGARDLEAFVDRWERLPLFESQRALGDALRRSRRSERLRHTPLGIAWCLRTLTLGKMPCWDDLSSVSPRVDLVTGELDTKFMRIAERLAASDHRTTHHVIEGAGHDVVLEAPQALACVLTELIGTSGAAYSASHVSHSEAS